MNFDRFFRLNERRGDGVFCGKEGLFVGDTALLEQIQIGRGRVAWRVRSRSRLEPELSKSYGVSVDFGVKMAGTEAVARALTDGDIALAQISALLLQFPDPPPSKGGEAPLDQSIGFVGRMRMSGLFKGDWDPQKHPRWPGGAADGVGGQFAPAGGDGATTESQAAIIPAQIAIPMPFEESTPAPLPFEIVPPIVTPIFRELSRKIPTRAAPSV
jgi:hypothetical protein